MSSVPSSWLSDVYIFPKESLSSLFLSAKQNVFLPTVKATSTYYSLMVSLSITVPRFYKAALLLGEVLQDQRTSTLLSSPLLQLCDDNPDYTQGCIPYILVSLRWTEELKIEPPGGLPHF